MMCEEMIFEYWFSTIRKLSARKKYLLRELIGSGKKIYYIEETEIIGIQKKILRGWLRYQIPRLLFL